MFPGGFDPFGGMMGGGAGGQSLMGGLPSLLSGGANPQQQGYGISDPTMPMPFDTGPGLMPGTPQDFQNGDLRAAGAAETAYANMADRFEAPGAMSQFWGQAQGAFQQPGMGERFARGALGKYADGTPGVTQNSATEYNRSVSGQPQVAANMDPFYDNAQRKSLEAINQQMAARGMMGGTAGMDRAAEAITDLRAQQARDEAQYGLQRSGDMRAWQGLQGQLAGQADQGSRMQSANELEWLRGLGDMAFSGQQAGLGRLAQGGSLAGAADSADLARMMGGMSAAQGAQAAQRARMGDYFDRSMGLGGALGGLANNTYDQMFAGDMQLMDSAMGMELGLGAEALNQDYRGQQRIKDDVDWAWEKIPILGSMGGGGGGGLF